MNRFHNERGATLVMVLILLILITSVGLYATRHSIFSLKVATNAQVQTMLMQTSDVALDHLEKHFNSNEANNLAGTPIGQVLLDGNQGKELQFCFKPTEVGTNKNLTNNLFFSLRDFRILTRESKTSLKASTKAESGDINAYCDPSRMFSISRKALVTQVALVNPDDPAIEMNRFDLTTKGTDLKEVNIDTKRVRVIVTSLAPALAPSVSLKEMETCLKTYLMDDMALSNMEDKTASQKKVKTVHECLSELGVPLNTQVAEYTVNLAESKS